MIIIEIALPSYGANHLHGTVQESYGSGAFKQFGRVGQLSLTNVFAVSRMDGGQLPAYFIEPVIHLISSRQRLLVHLIAFF